MHWIDRTSETDNVIVVDTTTILVGSCDKEHYDSVEQQLNAGKTALEVLGTEDLTSIPLSQIQKVVSRSTDPDVDVSYKAKKEIEDKSLYFEAIESKQAFVDELGRLLPENLVKSEVKQSALGAALNPLLSLVLSGAAVYLFMDKLRWVAIGVGGLWALISLYMLARRITSPPTITRWSIGGRYVRKAWSGLKTAASYVVLAAIIAVAHDAMPDGWGSRSLYDQMDHEMLSASSVATLLERGADIDYQDEYGDTALLLALDWGYDDVAIALIEAGSDLTLKGSYDMTPIEYAVSYDLDISVVQALLQHGASLDFEIDGMSPLEYSQEYEYRELEALFVGLDL